MAITPETRDYRTFEVRALPQEGSDGQKQCRVEGYAAVFDQETVLYEYDGIQYKEVIDRNAFSGAEMRDVVMNFNHGGKPVARTKNGTLTLTVDTKGLHIVADLSGTEEGRRLYEEIRGGYIDRMSFAFTVNKQEYDRAKHIHGFIISYFFFVRCCHNGFSGEGTLTWLKVDSDVLKLVAEAYLSGVMPEITIITAHTQKGTNKVERIAFTNIVVTEVMLVKFEKKTKTEMELPYKFGNFEVLETIAA